MIELSGPMDLGSDMLCTRSSTGVQLTLTAFAPHAKAIDGVAYRLIWSGPKAQAFYTQYGVHFRTGRRVMVTGRHPRAVIDRGEVCILLDVVDIGISGLAASLASGDANKRLASTNSTPTAPIAQFWPWPQKQGQGQAAEQVRWVDHEVGA